MHESKILSNDELKKIICGAVYFDEADGLIPYRLTKEKLDVAEVLSTQKRKFTATGIKIEFYSDTEELSFDYTAFVEFVSSLYKLYFFDIYADGVLIFHQGERNIVEDTSGTVSVKFRPGNKKITVYLPGSCAVKIKNFKVSHGANISPVSYDEKALFLGDSITHAAYVDFPSLTYANVISKRRNYFTVNQAIGGAVFSESHLEHLPDLDFDNIFIAYGTNDWRSSCVNTTAPERIEAFFAKLNGLYAKANKYIILPIWRADIDEATALTYSLEDIRQMIRKAALKYKMEVIDLFDSIPHDPRLYHDKFLHPNEMGFAYYADEVEKYLAPKSSL